MTEPAFSFTGDRIELLQTFVRIVESGNLSAAAVRMDTTQPTVSRRLQALERLFGVRLLQRSTHAVTLTPDGERCFALAQSLLEEWQALQDNLRGAKDAPTGLLKVVVPHALGQEQLVEPLAHYLQAFPEVQVEWLLHDRWPDFAAEGIDCAIRAGAIDDPSVVAVRLFEVPRIVVCAPALLAGGEPPQEPAALQELPWLAMQTFYRDAVALHRVAPPQAETAATATTARTGDAETETFAIRPRLSTDSLYALRSAALAGLGAAIVSAWLVQDDLRTGRLVHLAPGWAAPALPVHLVHPYAKYYPARLRRFLEAVKQTSRAGPGG